jgi:hypothetical protein
MYIYLLSHLQVPVPQSTPFQPNDSPARISMTK